MAVPMEVAAEKAISATASRACSRTRTGRTATVARGVRVVVVLTSTPTPAPTADSLLGLTWADSPGQVPSRSPGEVAFWCRGSDPRRRGERVRDLVLRVRCAVVLLMLLVVLEAPVVLRGRPVRSPGRPRR